MPLIVSSKVFMGAKTFNVLEDERNVAITYFVTQLQAYFRGALGQIEAQDLRDYKKKQHAAKIMQCAVRRLRAFRVYGDLLEKKRVEEELRRQEEARIRREEEEARRRKELEEQRRREAEERKRKALEEEERSRQEEARRKEEEESRKGEQEAARRREEQMRRDEEKRRAEEERRRQEQQSPPSIPSCVSFFTSFELTLPDGNISGQPDFNYDSP